MRQTAMVAIPSPPPTTSREPPDHTMSMNVELVKEFSFEAAHLLPNVPEGHKCRRLHGHSYRVTVTVKGEIDEEMGWLIDYAEIKEAFEPLRRRLAHYSLHDIEGLENPTSEILARWIWDRLVDELPMLHAIQVHETCESSCIYRGE